LIIHNLLEFRERKVESVFTHRTDVFAVSYESTLHEAVQHMLATPHSRIPVYRKDKDDIVGLITIREALRLYVDSAHHEKKLQDFHFHAIKKIPITASIFDVFLDMKKNGRHFCVVIDEYGGTAGIVTFEDVLEDLVGSIRDEADFGEEGEIIKIDASTLKVKGDVPLRDTIDMLQVTGFKLPEALAEQLTEEETVSYFILHELQDFAKK
jgi:putative hemolysin